MKNSCFKFLTAAAAGTLFATGAFAQQDECVDALPLGFDTLTAFDTTGATESAPDFSCAATNGDLTSRDVWFEFTSTADYAALVTTCGTAGYDTKIEVYSGSCGALVSEACVDDTPGCAGFTTDVSFAATTGTQYWVRIGGWQLGEFGTGDVLLVGPPPPPFECADAADIATDSLTDFDTTGATISAPDFSCAASGGDLTSPDVWFKFTAAADYTAMATTCGTAAYDTKIEIYSGTCGALISEACNDDTVGCAGFTSEVSWAAVTGTEYFVRIGGWQTTDSGSGQVLVTGPPPAVANDECSGAIALGSGVPEAFDNALATFSAGAPAPSCGNGVLDPLDLWYSFTALEDGTVDVSTCGSGFDTRLEVYSGDCGALVSEACEDDNGPLCAGSEASVSFVGVAGTTYYARVAGFSGDSGAGTLTATYPDSLGNDDCSGAFPISAGRTSFTNIGATDSGVGVACSTIDGGETDVWFTYTASEDCPVNLDFRGSLYDTNVQVHTGDCMNLTAIACDDDSGSGAPFFTSFLNFDATAGTTYLIQVGGWQADSGTGTINLTEGVGSIVCVGLPNSTGFGATLKISGSVTATDNDLTLNVAGLPVNENLLFVNSQEVNFVAGPGGSMGNLCIASFDMGRYNSAVMNSGATGTVSLTLNLANTPTGSGPMAAMAGQTWYWQGWYRDTVAMMATSNFTSATCVTLN